jgi:hypothetical protein
MQIQPKSARIGEPSGLRVDHVGRSAARLLLADRNCDEGDQHEEQW